VFQSYLHTFIRRNHTRAGFTLVLTCGLVLAALAGCSQQSMETGYADQGRTQLQFFSPPGAAVAVRADCSSRSHQIATYGPFENRLEQSPEEFAIFNLKPGKYEAKYVSADGLLGVSIYMELDVKHANWHEARVFQRRSFIPIALPSEYYRKVEVAGDEIFPYRGEAFRTAIDELDLQRIKQGDVIEKVFFVANLEKAAKVRDKAIRDLKVLEREMEYADMRFRLAYQDYRIDVSDSAANFWGTDREFIDWEKERQDLAIKYAKLEKKLARAQALLKGDHVLIRKGMLAVATEEIVKPYKDVVDASEDVGEVLLVMRIGGRHMQWGDPGQELAAFEH